MANTTGTPSALLISTAKMDARKSVSKWRWVTLGVSVSCLPVINLSAFGIVVVFAYLLIPKIDLSTPERLQIYSEHPARYTEQYRKTAKKLRILSIFCGWVIGMIFLNPF